VFLFCLTKLNYIKPSKFESAVRDIFYEYIRFIREVQMLYNLEPAGSHGVWGLDDYHFIPFLLGAAELDNFILRSTDKEG
jgi:serine/threonine-protein phosphatase 2A activator